jgi:hypothetical protein
MKYLLFTAIYSAFIYNDAAEINEIREKGGIKAVVNLLTSPNETLQAHAAKALSVISADGMQILYVIVTCDL